MRMPRARFTVRGLMIAVAVAASLLGAASWLRGRSDAFGRLADHHSRMGVRMSVSGGRSAHHWRMHRKYRDASSRPWLPVAPDPPEPE